MGAAERPLDAIVIHPARQPSGILDESPYAERRSAVRRRHAQEAGYIPARRSERVRVATPDRFRVIALSPPAEEPPRELLPPSASAPALSALEPAAGAPQASPPPALQVPVAAAPAPGETPPAQEEVLTPMEELAPESTAMAPQGDSAGEGLLSLPGFSEGPQEGAAQPDPAPPSLPELALPPPAEEAEQVAPPPEPAVKSMSGGKLLDLLRPEPRAQAAAGGAAQPAESAPAAMPAPEPLPAVMAKAEEKQADETLPKSGELERIADDLKRLSRGVPPPVKDDAPVQAAQQSPPEAKNDSPRKEAEETEETGEAENAENKAEKPAAPPPSPPAAAAPPATHEEILDSIARNVGSGGPEKGQEAGPVDIKHTRPVDKQLAPEQPEVKTHESLGIKIEVKTPPPDVNYRLEQAYDALIAGYPERSIEIYREVLDTEPDNTLALFGLATTYHRVGQLSRARELYGRLIAIDPKHTEAVSNYLSLVAEESPEEARDKLKDLERGNPDYSPVAAQLALIYEKLGDFDHAVEQIRRAVEMSPENLSYRYNYAIILDKAGKWSDAAAVYRQLIDASERGQPIPGNTDQIQERLTFIMSNKTM